MSSPVRYHVRRQEYSPPTAAGVRRVLPEKWTTVATFPKPADAHAECARQLADARRTLNPFQLGGPNLFYQTSLPAYALHDYLLDHGLTPPPTATSSNPNYVFWWVKHNRTFTDAERAAVWTACDKLKLFEVVEEDDRQAAHLVLDAAVEFSARTGDYELVEGGVLSSAHPTRSEANKECRERRRALRGQLDPEDDDYQVPEDRLAVVISVPLANGPLVGPASVLCRQGYSGDEGGFDFFPHDAEQPNVVPLAADTSPLGSETNRRESVARLRRTVNPFALLGWDDIDLMSAYHLRRSTVELSNGLTVEDAFAAVRRLDTTPPPPEDNELLADWYDQVVQWSPEFIDVIWGTFADFRLFEVVEVPFG
jgi:hypothetical protein